MVLAIEPIMEQAGSDHGRCGELQRERDFFAGQAEALRDQLERLLQRLAAEAAPTSTFAFDDVLAATLAVTSFPTYDRLGPLADDPDRAARLIDHLVRSLLG